MNHTFEPWTAGADTCRREGLDRMAEIHDSNTCTLDHDQPCFMCSEANAKERVDGMIDFALVSALSDYIQRFGRESLCQFLDRFMSERGLY